MAKKSKERVMTKAKKKKMFSDQPFELREAFNVLRTNIRFASIDGNIKKILITSAVPNEGKSCVSVNVAKALAKGDASVILVDCDLRKPSLGRYTGIVSSKSCGLTSCLCGEQSLKDCIEYDVNSKLYFLPAGMEVPNPSEILGSKTFQKLLDTLAERFDYVICDTPPVEVVADAAALSAYCDGVILVVRQKYSSRDKVKHAVNSLKAVNANILGIVLNEYEDEQKNKGKYDKYGYEYISPVKKHKEKH